MHNGFYAQVTRFTLAEFGIDFNQHEETIPFQFTHVRPEYARKNPNMLVPALEMPGGIMINDSRKICKYFDNSPENPEVEDLLDLMYENPDMGRFAFGTGVESIFLLKYFSKSGFIVNRLMQTIRHHQKQRENHDLIDAYERKIEESTQKIVTEFLSQKTLGRTLQWFA